MEGVGSLEWQRATRETGSTSAAPPAISASTFPRQHWPRDLGILQHDIHLIEIKRCENTRPQNQQSAVQEQHKGLCTILQGASTSLHAVLSGVGGTIYNTPAFEPFKDLGLDSQRVRRFASSLVCIISTTLLNLSILDKPITYYSHQTPVPDQACDPPYYSPPIGGIKWCIMKRTQIVLTLLALGKDVVLCSAPPNGCRNTQKPTWRGKIGWAFQLGSGGWEAWACIPPGVLLRYLWSLCSMSRLVCIILIADSIAYRLDFLHEWCG
jgi:hypothetical protein